MNKSILISAVVACCFLLSCNKADVPTPKGSPFEIIVNSEATKTTYSYPAIRWVAGDQIRLFHAEYNTTAYVDDGAFTATSGGDVVTTFTGTLSGSLTAETYDWYAFYPYNSSDSTPNWFRMVKIGSKAGDIQHQATYDDRAHLVGEYFPLYGKSINVVKSKIPSINMRQVASVAKIVVTNNSSQTLQINRVRLNCSGSNGGRLIGEFIADITGDSISFVGYTEVGTSAIEIDTPEDLANGESATIYLGLRPFTVDVDETITITVETDKGSQTKTCAPLTSAFTFVGGRMHALSFNLDNPE